LRLQEQGFLLFQPPQKPPVSFHLPDFYLLIHATLKRLFILRFIILLNSFNFFNRQEIV